MAIVASRVRYEEKQIFATLESRGIAYNHLDSRSITFDPQMPGEAYDVVINRCISFNRGRYATHAFEASETLVVNTSQVLEICGNKYLTHLALRRANIPTPRTALALSPDSALAAIETIGYPVVLKPMIGSWGRLVSKVNDQDAAEGILEHKKILGSLENRIFLVQEYVNKPGYDLRTIVIGDEVIGAMYRTSSHWITNTARNGKGVLCPLRPDIVEISLQASRAVGGGVLAVDIFETADRQLLVNEVNHTMEFRSLIEATNIDVAGCLVDYILKQVSQL